MLNHQLKKEKSNPDIVIEALESHITKQHSPIGMIASILKTCQEEGEPFQSGWLKVNDKIKEWPKPAAGEDPLDWLSKLALCALIHNKRTFHMLQTTENFTLAEAE
jgi:hypothetical protein